MEEENTKYKIVEWKTLCHTQLGSEKGKEGKGDDEATQIHICQHRHRTIIH